MNQAETVAHFRQLHGRRPLILPNAWDAASGRVIEAAGAPAIATTSAGVSWSFGRADGQRLRREEMLQVIRNIVESVRVPVSADMESAYGNGSGKDVADTVQALISMGVAGINLEDSPGHEGQVLLAPEDQAERIRVARQSAASAGGDLLINARTDLYLFQVGDRKRGSPPPWSAHGCTGVPARIVCLCRASSISARFESWLRRSKVL